MPSSRAGTSAPPQPTLNPQEWPYACNLCNIAYQNPNATKAHCESEDHRTKVGEYGRRTGELPPNQGITSRLISRKAPTAPSVAPSMVSGGRSEPEYEAPSRREVSADPEDRVRAWLGVQGGGSLASTSAGRAGTPRLATKRSLGALSQGSNGRPAQYIKPGTPSLGGKGSRQVPSASSGGKPGSSRFSSGPKAPSSNGKGAGRA